MAETINSLEDLGSSAAVTAAAPAAPVHVQKLDKEGRAYATGKRKNAIARVWVKPGSGKITVNGKEFNQFFARPVLQIAAAPARSRSTGRSPSATIRTSAPSIATTASRAVATPSVTVTVG